MITTSATIEGWMSAEELEWLAEAARSHSAIVELGCYLGRSTRALAENTPGKVYAVDDFKGPRDAEVSNRHSIESRFRANVAGLPVVVMKANHRDLMAWDFIGIPVDFMFIDGSHEYEHVAQDITLAKRVVRPGGLIAGHDYGWPGVRRAVDELLGEVQVRGSIWHKTVPSR